ncbi:MAG: protein BatD [Bacteroidetes bacterium]|nr:MAG: protein BatD [Bacteroidota bacterium]
MVLFCRYKTRWPGWLLSLVMKHLLMLIWCVCALLQHGIAQISFTTKASASKIAKNELLEVSYEAQNGNIENITPPTFTGWQLVSGPNMSSSSMTVNGQTTSRMAYQYVLKPNTAGKLTLPGATATINGTQRVSSALMVTVDATDAPNGGGSLANQYSKADALPNAPPVQDDYDGYLLRSGENAQRKIAANLFLQVNVSKQQCFEGEPLVAEYKLYSRVSLNASVTKRPSFNGFSSVDMRQVSNNEYDLVRLNGKMFKVYTVRRVQLFPLQSGQLTLEPVEIDATVQFRVIPSYQNMQQYDPYSPDNYVNVPYLVKSNPISINVVPLPTADKPASFDGAVGRFTIAAKLDKSELALQQVGSYEVELQGIGNWAMVQAPKLSWPPGVEAFEPKIIENLDSQAIPLKGKRVYIFRFSSKVPGKLVLPTFSLTFFDPWLKRYDTIVTGPASLVVTNETSVTETPVGAAGSSREPSLLADVVTIATPLLLLGTLTFVVLRKRRARKLAHYRRKWRQSLDEVVHEPQTRYSTDASSSKGSSKRTAIQARPEPYTAVPAAVETALAPTGSPQSDFKKYLTDTKKQLLNQLKQKWSIGPSNLQTELIKRGFSANDADLVAALVADIDNQLYNPLAEAVSQESFETRINQVLKLID